MMIRIVRHLTSDQPGATDISAASEGIFFEKRMHQWRHSKDHPIPRIGETITSFDPDSDDTLLVWTVVAIDHDLAENVVSIVVRP